MRLKTQKRIAADVMKCSPKRVKFDGTKLKEIKEAITKADIRGMIIDKFIQKERKKGISKSRARLIREQKVKGRRKGHGSRKGKKTARTPKKTEWMNRVRLQRDVISELKQKGKIGNDVYWDLYRKIKGGFFRSKRHLQIFIIEKKLSREVKKPEPVKKAERPRKKAKKTTKKKSER